MLIGFFGFFYNVSASNGDDNGEDEFVILQIFVDGGFIEDIDNYIYNYFPYGDNYMIIFSPGNIKLPSITKDGFIIDGFYYDEDYTEPVVWSDIGDGYIYLDCNLQIYVKWIKWKDIRIENTINIIFNSWFDLIKNLAVGLNTVFITLFISDGGLSLIGIWFLVIFGIGLAFFLISCVLKTIRKRE